MPGATLAVAVLCAVALAPAAPLSAQSPAPAASSSPDLDAFMEKVLARREVNRKALNDYVLDDDEVFEILGPGRLRLLRTRREFTWYVRDGMHVRSPVRFEGVPVGPEARDEYEREWIARELRRQERLAKKEREKKEGEQAEREKKEISIGTEGLQITGPGSAEPRFVSEAYFMDFKFEPGNYYLAGREKLEGTDVLRVEYYPKRLFSDDDKKTPREMKRESGGDRRERELEDDIERKMNKTALVTLWIDPALHQIVKYTFDNVWLDFLPGAWLVRIDDMRASMTMGQPFPGVWLPNDINIRAGFTLANGSYEGAYQRGFSKYRAADVKTTIRVPKIPESEPDIQIQPDAQFDGRSDEIRSGPVVIEAETENEPVESQQPGVETVREIRVHGNAFLSDADVLRLAGIDVGATIQADAVDAIRKRLKDSGRFETVEVRKRYRSLTDMGDVALILVVHERPGIQSATDPVNPIARPWQRFRHGLMFLPIISFADGYGFTYGGRVSAVDTLGFGERLSVPLTWGGTRRAALEFERTFARGPLTRVTSSAAIWQRENPRFEIDDRRVELKAGIERQFAHVLRLGVETSRSSVEFGTIDDRLWTLGTTATLDTRGNPSYPTNAVYLGGGWNGLHVEDRPRINRYDADARGYLRVIGQTVLAGRARYLNSDAPLPQYERLLLGGSSSLRGFRTGAFDGDRILMTSAELRIPLTSVIRGAKLGFTIFADAAKAADYGTSFDEVKWQRGAGAGIFMIASIVKLNLDIARGLDGGGTRVHLGSGFTF